MKRIYVSGKMSDLPDFNFDKFEKAERQLLDKGYSVVNPHKIPENQVEGMSWGQYMVNDLRYILQCDAIAVLDDWTTSPGAQLEMLFAQREGKKIYLINNLGDLEEFYYKLSIKSELALS